MKNNRIHPLKQLAKGTILDLLIMFFSRLRGINPPPNSAGRICREVREQVDVPNFHHHSCRHYRAIELLEQSVSTEAVQRFLDHEELSTTQEYLRGSREIVFKELCSKDKIMKSSGGDENE